MTTEDNVHHAAGQLYGNQGHLSPQNIRIKVREVLERELDDLLDAISKLPGPGPSTKQGEEIAWQSAIVEINRDIEFRLRTLRNGNRKDQGFDPLPPTTEDPEA